MQKKILIVEDEPGILLSLQDEFESEGYIVIRAEDGEEGLDAARNEDPDLIVLDVMMPVLNGYEVCKQLRKEGNNTPILMLTVKDKEIDKVLGLELGADDYVTKPFSLREVVARVKAILRRTEDQSDELTTFSIGDINLDFRKYEAYRGTIRIELTPLEFRMLKVLIRKKEQVIERNDFLDEIWGEDNVVVSSRTIDSHIVNLRKKIENEPSNPKEICNRLLRCTHRLSKITTKNLKLQQKPSFISGYVTKNWGEPRLLKLMKP